MGCTLAAMTTHLAERVIVGSRRRVAVHRGSGQPEHTVVLCHSSPGSSAFDPDPMQTRSSGVSLLAVDRPGYGGSDRIGADQWATVASAADDIAVVLESQRIERVGVVGWSAGGRVALALAARHPELVDRVAVVATPAPDEEVSWIAPEQRDALERLRGQPPSRVHAELTALVGPLVPVDPFADEALGVLAAGRADEDTLRTPGVKTRLGEMLRAAFVQDAAGIAADIAGYCLQPWGFEPSEVEAETLLVYGTHDAVAGPSHGRWYEARLPNARLEVVPGAGHLLLIPMWRRILSYLAPDRARRRSREGSPPVAA